MAITLNTIQEAIDFVEGLDGYGLATTDHDLLARQLERHYDLDDDYHPVVPNESSDIRSAVGGSERFD